MLIRILCLLMLFHSCCTAETFQESLQMHIRFSPEGQNRIGYISIDDHSSGITQGTWLYVKNALEYYQKNPPAFIILNLNTPGGEVYAAQKISDALKDMDIQFNVPIIAYINNWAISAGAMLAYSSRYIVAVKDASMGAAEPITATETGEMKQASEKVNSALRADFANRANFFGRNPLIAEAMVDKDMILVLRDNQVTKLDAESQIRSTDTVISPKGKLLTLTSDELIKYKVADLQILPTKTGMISEAEREEGKWPASKMALFHTPFFDAIPNAVVDAYRMDWKTQFFVWLANPVVSSLLFMGLMLGFYMEMNSPGFGLPGTIALTCLVLIALSSFALEIGNVLELLLLLIGAVMIAAEFFLVPTAGLLGIIGAIFFFMGLFGLMLPGIGSIDYEFDTNTFNAAGEAFLEKLVWLSGALLLSFGIMALLAKYLFPSMMGWSRLVLKGNEQTDYYAVDTAREFPPIGSRGAVLAALRPAGKVVIDDKIYEAISTGRFIDKDKEITVVGAESGVIVVREI